MNIHVSEEIRLKYPNMEFRGKPRTMKGRTIIEAYNHAINQNYFYSFEEDFFWFPEQIPDWILPKVK